MPAIKLGQSLVILYCFTKIYMAIEPVKDLLSADTNLVILRNWWGKRFMILRNFCNIQSPQSFSMLVETFISLILFKSFELCFSALQGNYSWLQHNYTQLTVQTQM